MGVLPLDSLSCGRIIEKFGEKYEQKKYNRESLRRIFTNTNRVSEKTRCWNISDFRMEKGKNTKNGRTSIKANAKEQRTARAVAKNKRNLGNNSRNRVKYLNFFTKQENMLDFFRFSEYNPIILKTKGFKMTTKQSTKKQSHLSELIISSEIEHEDIKSLKERIDYMFECSREAV